LRGGSRDEDPADVVLVLFTGSFPKGFGSKVIIHEIPQELKTSPSLPQAMAHQSLWETSLCSHGGVQLLKNGSPTAMSCRCMGKHARIQSLFWSTMALDEEEKFARDSPSVYSNVIKLRIVKVTKMGIQLRFLLRG
jgi:hypothetical protein